MIHDSDSVGNKACVFDIDLRLCCSGALARRSGARHPRRRDRAGICQTGRASGCICWFACRSRPCATSIFRSVSGAIWIWMRLAPLLPDAASLWISDFIDDLRRRHAAAKAPRCGDPRVAAIRQILRLLRRGAGARHRAEAREQRERCLEPGDVRRAVRVPDSLGSIPLFDPPAARAIWPSRVVTVLRFLPPGGAVRAFEFRAIPALSASIRAGIRPPARFVELGFFHILDGTDHLLFLLCLVIPFRRFRALIPVVTAFTVAHSITLIASAYNLAPDALWFPPLIETLIAMSIVYMALENIVGGTHRAPPLDDRVRIRPGARVRFLVRAARDAAVRRVASADVAALVQHRRRAGATSGARCCSSRCSKRSSDSWWPNGWAPSSCRRWWPTPAGIG